MVEDDWVFVFLGVFIVNDDFICFYGFVNCLWGELVGLDGLVNFVGCLLCIGLYMLLMFLDVDDNGFEFYCLEC